MQKLKVLAVDDNVLDLEAIEAALARAEIGVAFEIQVYGTRADLLAAMPVRPDIVVVDLHLERRQDRGTSPEGLGLIAELRATGYTGTVVARSSTDDPALIIKSLNAGASDFISKEAETSELPVRLLHAYQRDSQESAQLRQGGAALGSAASDPKKQLLAAGATLRRIQASIQRVVTSAVSTVHVHGESGTGKEVVADLLQAAHGAAVPFIRVNCGAISPTLLESELFGYVKGAFTGAQRDRMGYFERASGGWIFLDEIATLPPSSQAALLRVIENQEVIRVGDHTPRKIKVKVMTATNEALEELVERGAFRNDLYQRLVEKTFHLTPLRERTEELDELIDHFCRTMDGGPYDCVKPARLILKAYDWRRGNVRELRNCLRAMTERAVDRNLTPSCLPGWILAQAKDEPYETQEASAPSAAAGVGFTVKRRENENFEDMTDRLLIEVVRYLAAGGKTFSIRALATQVGLSKSTFSDRMKRVLDKGLAEPSFFDAVLK